MMLITWARGFFVAAAAILLLMFLSVAWFPLIVGKVALASVCIAVAALLGAAALARAEVELPSVALVPLLLPLVYALSWWFSSDRAVGLLGSGIDADSLVFVSIAALCVLLGAMLVQGGRSAGLLSRAVMWALSLAAVFQAVVLIFGLPGPFSDRSVNLIGKWNDFALAISLLLLFILTESEFGNLSRLWRTLAWVGGAALLVALGLINFAAAWGILLAAAIAVAVISFLSGRRAPLFSLAVVVVSVVFLFFGSGLSGGLAKVLPASSFEVRPSMQTTIEVTAASHGSSIKAAALGTGPGTFGIAWLSHKPAEVNRSAFWNLDFNVGFSTLFTVFSTVGLLGVLAWLIMPVLILLGLWRSRAALAGGALWTWQLAAAALFMWTALALYVPSPSLILLGFILGGAALGALWRGALRGRGAMLFGAAVLVLLALFSGILSARRLISQSMAGQAAAAANAGDLAGAQTFAARAASVEGTADTYRLQVDIASALVSQLSAATSSAETQAQLKAALDSATAAGQQAVAADPADYRSYLSLAQLYAFLAQNKVAGAYEAAKGAYTVAAARSPQNPSIPLSLARLEGAAGTSTQALQGYLQQALSLKPDYTDAILFVVQLDIAQNDLPGAVRDAKVAVQTAPGVPGIWFELGLLYYAQHDSANAALAFEQALVLEPQYANAQYYLGLSYAAAGRLADALTQFEALEKTNPGNPQVESILTDLRAGKAPAAAGLPAQAPVQ